MRKANRFLLLPLVLALLGLGAALPYLAGLWQDRAIDGVVESGEISEIQLTFNVPSTIERILLTFSGSSVDAPPDLGNLTEGTILAAAEDALESFAQIEELDFLTQPHSIEKYQKFMFYDQGVSALFWWVLLRSDGAPEWSFEMWLDDATGKMVNIALVTEDEELLFERHGYDATDENAEDLLFRLNAHFYGELGLQTSRVLRLTANGEYGMELVTTPLENVGLGELVFILRISRWGFSIFPDTFVSDANPVGTAPMWSPDPSLPESDR